MDHQGIFRVPGSSTEINDMKEAFENGKNTLHDTVAEISVGWGGGQLPTHLSSNCQFVGNFHFIGSSETHELFYKTVIISKFPTN